MVTRKGGWGAKKERNKEEGHEALVAQIPPEGGGVPKIGFVQWTSKGTSLNVKADGFLSRPYCYAYRAPSQSKTGAC